MPSTGSVTRWLEQLPEGDSLAIQRLWERYFGRLVVLARRNLRNAPRRASDEEDVALSAFDSFCLAVKSGRFPKLQDRDDLWQLLVMLTIRKASNLRQFEVAGKRDFRRVQKQGDRNSGDSADQQLFISEQILSREPDPQLVVQVAERCQALLEKLNEDRFRLRTIAVRKMEGWTNEEIAVHLGVALSTVELRLRRIRKQWQADLQD